jgi:hypothetical protein
MQLTSITANALENVPTLGLMEDLNTLLTEIDLSEAIDYHAFKKARGGDCIPAEALQNGKSALQKHPHKLLLQYCHEVIFLNICKTPTLLHSINKQRRSHRLQELWMHLTSHHLSKISPVSS